jgi:thiol-disulfide isomerase/thioredoxin
MSAAKVVLVIVLAGGISVGTAILGERLLAPETSGGERAQGGGAQLQTLPELRLPDLEGREVSSSAWGGKVVVLNYWASWCPPCIREMPDMIRAQEALGGRGVQFVGIAVDRPDEVRAFLVDHPVNYPILIGDPAAVELARRLGNRVQGLPFTAIFDAKGRRVFSRSGELGGEELKAQLDALLGPAPAPAPEPLPQKPS